MNWSFQDDDDEHLDASESVILENDLDESPKSTKRKIDEITNNKIEIKSAPPKKVILNRHTSIEMTKSIIDSTEKKQEDAKEEQKDEKKVIKLSSLSAKEVIYCLFWKVFHKYWYLFLEVGNEGKKIWSNRPKFWCKKNS